MFYRVFDLICKFGAGSQNQDPSVDWALVRARLDLVLRMHWLYRL